MDKKIVIFDLDGTLALIDKRRAISTKDNGKMDWAKFFDPDMVDLDDANTPVITMAMQSVSSMQEVTVSSIPLTTAKLRAFAGGLLMVRTPTAPSFLNSITSLIGKFALY